MAYSGLFSSQPSLWAAAASRGRRRLVLGRPSRGRVFPASYQEKPMKVMVCPPASITSCRLVQPCPPSCTQRTGVLSGTDSHPRTPSPGRCTGVPSHYLRELSPGALVSIERVWGSPGRLVQSHCSAPAQSLSFSVCGGPPGILTGSQEPTPPLVWEPHLTPLLQSPQ